MGEIKKMHSHLFAWLVKHELVHRSLSSDYKVRETSQIKSKYWDSIVVISVIYALNVPMMSH